MQNPFIVQAFTLDGRGGNGAGVVLEADSLTANQKLSIAARVGLSETAFVSRSECADFHLEYFTPVAEVDLCGHATIATFVLLHDQGLASGSYTIETRSGILTIEVDPDGTIWMQQCLPSFLQQYPRSDFAQALPGARLHPDLPVQAVSTGLPDIMLPMADIEALRDLRPDFDALVVLNERQQVVGIHAFALSGHDDPVAECRNFAPCYGIPEESATGTSNCALACYLYRHHHKASRYRFLQGLSMGSPSAIEVRLGIKDQQIGSVWVGGKGRIVN